MPGSMTTSRRVQRTPAQSDLYDTPEFYVVSGRKVVAVATRARIKGESIYLW